ncbi:NAC domain-containing protein 83 [Salvia hispanica]|uniref:NAC domain-containing protein 83 n=1 Tax=Salvia hispanica TaxID=49212 RepID=UPI002009712B|nr:NAC domain-containing protein 83 [Salvia hispanica]
MEIANLPIGFRFNPTDAELLYYLKKKVLSLPLPANVIPELEAFQFNPWDLPGGLNENRFFFCKRKKNLMSKCSSFSTDCGYWKSSGKEKQIVAGESNHVIGMMKTFVFYQGRNMKTQWIMQEFTIVGHLKTPFLDQRLMMKVGNWVVCRLYQRRMRARNHGAAELGHSIAQTTPFLPSSSSSSSSDISSSDLDE